MSADQVARSEEARAWAVQQIKVMPDWCFMWIADPVTIPPGCERVAGQPDFGGVVLVRYPCNRSSNEIASAPGALL